MGMIVAPKRSFIGRSAASIAAAIMDDRSAGIVTGETHAGTEIGGAVIGDDVACARGTATSATDAADAGTVPSEGSVFFTLPVDGPITTPTQDF